MSTEQVGEWLRHAKHVAVLTGAGISAESGVPTFRGAGGLWKHFRLEDLATPQAFQRDPSTVWEWYGWRRSLILQCTPNAGHLALAALERRIPSFTLITQNVDGLHLAAGSRNVLEIHGSIWTLRCTACAREWTDRTHPLPVAPRCSCGALARPGVVWFGETLPPTVWTAAEEAAASCEVFLVVGTAALVYPAAGLAHVAASRRARVVEINLEKTALSPDVDVSLTGPAGQILPRLVSPE